MTQMRSFLLDPSSPEAERFWSNKAGQVQQSNVTISEAATPLPVAAGVAVPLSSSSSSSGPKASASKGAPAPPPKPKAIKSTSAASFFGGAAKSKSKSSAPAAASSSAKVSAAPPSTFESRMSTAGRKRAEARAKRDATLFDDEEEDTSKLGVSSSGARSKAEVDAAREDDVPSAAVRKRPRNDVVDDSDSDSDAPQTAASEGEQAQGAAKKPRGGAKAKGGASGDGTLGDIPQAQYEEMGLKRDKKGNIVLPEADAAVMDAFVEGAEAQGGAAAAAGGGKKRQKLVEYTYMDEKGYMVTSKKWVDCEDDDPEAAPAPAPAAAPKRAVPAASSSTSKGKSSGKPKAAKQAGLMSFFGKKK